MLRQPPSPTRFPYRRSSDLTRTSQPSGTGTCSAPRSSRCAPSSGTSSESQGPEGRPGGVDGPLPADGVPSDWASSDASTRSSSRSSSPRRRNNGTSASCALDTMVAHAMVAEAAGRPEAALGANRVGQLVDDLKARPLDPLHDQLRQPLATLQRDRPVPVKVDDDHLDLPAVARVDRPWRVDQRQTVLGGEPGPRMDERGVAVG